MHPLRWRGSLDNRQRVPVDYSPLQCVSPHCLHFNDTIFDRRGVGVGIDLFQPVRNVLLVDNAGRLGTMQRSERVEDSPLLFKSSGLDGLLTQWER